MIRWIGLVAGPLVAAIVYFFAPTEFGDGIAFSPAGRMTVASLCWMGIWWMSEAIPLPATALLPLVIFPILGVASIKETSAPFASPLIYLFLGGFLMAATMQRWGLDKRIALLVLRAIGSSPRKIVFAFMLVAAIFSAFVSNTATAAMMLPLGLGVLAITKKTENVLPPPALLLGIAYGASIGGLATIIGSPPNGFVVQFLASEYEMQVSFLDWMKLGVPIACLMLPLTWWLLVKFLHPSGSNKVEGLEQLVNKQLKEMGRPCAGEIATFIVFCFAVLAWVTRPFIVQVLPGVTDAGIAMTAGVALFVIPVNRKGIFALDWEHAVKIPWQVLILFGGGLSLAAAIKTNGVSVFFASYATALQDLHPVIILIVILAVVVFLTELTSNTATTAALVPILAAIALPLDLDRNAIVAGTALAASCAFMLPVATPPNAIVFGSGHVTQQQMMRAGFSLNIIGIILICCASLWLIPLVLG
ncbi:MAG: DASS family sodium-coupled anion symporter [Planctomycetes bacterium]|nr:DASS family sodium-coupled anion symporter [Planctomycetota bacterium]